VAAQTVCQNGVSFAVPVPIISPRWWEPMSCYRSSSTVKDQEQFAEPTSM
jgi:hypothetical protein